MATFYVYVCTTNGASWVSGSQVEVTDTRSLYFGSSARATYAKKISVGSWNDAMHVGSSTVVGATDVCAAPHAHNIKYISAGSASVDNGATGNVSAVTSAKAVRVRLVTSTACIVDAAQFWYGSGATAQSAPVNASCKAFAIGGASWSDPTPSSKLSLSTAFASGTGKSWHLGLSIKPLSIGFNSSNKFRVEVTYS